MLPQKALFDEMHTTNVTSVKLYGSPDQRVVGMFLRVMDGHFDLFVVDLITNNALELSIRCVDLQVLHQRQPLNELPRAKLTAVAFLITVHLLVHSQTVGRGELLAANSTRKHLRTVLGFVVITQSARVSELGRAFVTFERFLLLVLIAVAFQICQILELPAADGANVPLSLMFHSLVILQQSLEDERFRAFVTFVP